MERRLYRCEINKSSANTWNEQITCDSSRKPHKPCSQKHPLKVHSAKEMRKKQMPTHRDETTAHLKLAVHTDRLWDQTITPTYNSPATEIFPKHLNTNKKSSPQEPRSTRNPRTWRSEHLADANPNSSKNHDSGVWDATNKQTHMCRPTRLWATTHPGLQT